VVVELVQTRLLELEELAVAAQAELTMFKTQQQDLTILVVEVELQTTLQLVEQTVALALSY
jgi:hypothetical protein